LIFDGGSERDGVFEAEIINGGPARRKLKIDFPNVQPFGPDLYDDRVFDPHRVSKRMP
jgi:hypothetical protein